MTQIITFSRQYPKLKNGQDVTIRKAKLMQVLSVELSELTHGFRNYDTAFGAIKLPEQGRALLLLFQKPGGNDLFSSIRPWTPEQQALYDGRVGEVWDVVIHVKQPA